MDRPDGTAFDVGDNGNAADEMFSIIKADAFLLHLLKGMNDRDKIILLYQVLRGVGYNLNHEDCAKTLSITRGRYMVLLKAVKKRAEKILQTTEG